MSELDYKLLAALDKVVSEQSFERAARLLHLTQSAVSQRIKQLELRLAQPLLVRGQPPQPTEAGRRLLAHYRQVSQLESAVMADLLPDAPQKPLTVTIVTNADSLATWLIPALTPLLHSHPIELNLLIEDESRSLERLKRGEAFGAISLHAEPLPGCRCDALGKMDYILVATPEFRQRYFAEGLSLTALQQAPAVAFDQRDDMHARYIERHFGLPPGGYPCHAVRSAEAFVAIARSGAAYCLIPRLMIADDLAQSRLVELYPQGMLIQPLYWHRWLLERGIHKDLSRRLIEYARQALPPLDP
ncbi:LysR family transcriptional regulator ArgP [Oceanisphaera arctica]|uniref:Transcriptional regulator ArgP n=1 Tax=Oceanisphaera arctica TaxID=641510 RepID=A0A2P5TLU2_9GAMM|nr:LysR family transcriptional regulator ArgP [Oceanisphaera arctica]PPL16318.1 transcriptional regulator ArgP [Oceanisphaera arctica]GHA28672.1 transcriptional regulator ArgP [Oceanisphaera arctica]